MDEGVLVKTGPDVQVSVRRAMTGADLGRLRASVEQEFLELDEDERNARSVDGQAGNGLPAPFCPFQA